MLLFPDLLGPNPRGTVETLKWEIEEKLVAKDCKECYVERHDQIDVFSCDVEEEEG